MIRMLHIENVALIASIDIPFDEGLTAVTGETGSGKSILVQSLAMLLGESADQNTIREGALVAVIEAECTPADPMEITRTLQSLDIEPASDQILTVRREINKKGRNRFLINDHAVSRQDFLKVTLPLIEINSQHEHQALLQPRNHLTLFDHAVHLDGPVESIARIHSHLSEITQSIEHLVQHLESVRQRSDLIRFQMNEIDQAGLKEGEKEELITEQQRLRYAEEIIRALREAELALGDSDEGLSSRTGPMIRSLQKASTRDPEIQALTEQAESLSVMIEDLSDAIRRYRDRVSVSPERLEEVNERLHFLQSMEGRYRNSIDGIIEYRRQIATEQQSMGDLDVQLRVLQTEWSDIFAEYLSADRSLSESRRRLAPGLCRRIEGELTELGMEKSRFEVAFGPVRGSESPPEGFRIPACFGPFGTDTLEFMLSANPGIPLKPLVRVASGGELSRITLALKQHLLSSHDADTVVFDEVDSGIGGQTAVAVARQLKRLARDRQILCVTHLPQLAVAADRHIVVRKTLHEESTQVQVEALDPDARLREIARMLTGSDDDPEALRHAQSLMDAAHSSTVRPV